MNHKDLQNLSEAYSNLYPYDGGRRVPLEIQKYTTNLLKKADITNKQRKMRTKETVPVRVNKETGEKKPMFENTYDLYDIILSHLLDEGYAETQEAAEVMMVHMSEEWRDSIVEGMEGMKPLPVAKMDKKAKELKSKFLKSKPGSPEATKLISRSSQITGTRDRQTV